MTPISVSVSQIMVRVKSKARTKRENRDTPRRGGSPSRPALLWVALPAPLTADCWGPPTHPCSEAGLAWTSDAGNESGEQGPISEFRVREVWEGTGAWNPANLHTNPNSGWKQAFRKKNCTPLLVPILMTVPIPFPADQVRSLSWSILNL